ncbi:FtsL-like putative cell division protein [Mucilaginibacter sp. McL0603]|uniref:FtsL-like putative cell division protein n=1 Tax=Mucilaginibacter sp. McL0603 TaxID=3415670 RepID=UPI003CF66F97
MTNRLRAEIPEDEVEKELVVEEKPTKEISENVLWRLFKRKVNSEKATDALPFVLFLVLLGMIYIGNMHLAEKNIRNIDKLNKEVKELTWDYKTTKADLAFKSTLSEVAKRVDTLGIKQSLEPPQRLKAQEVKDGN